MPNLERTAGASADDRIAALCSGLTNYERDRPDRPRFDLDNMHRLLARPDAPKLPERLVQVGGSKGKGTVVRYLAALARPRRTGAYVSPHVRTILERVAIDGDDVGEGLLTAELEPVLAFAREQAIAISFYEAMTAAALGCFARSGVELGILEVGLGGRLDATTAVPVDASVLTSVELEHTELLGDTIEAIATEKSFVVRPGKPAVTAVEGSALEVIQRRAREVGADLSVEGRDFGVEDLRADEHGFVGTLWHVDGTTAAVRVAGAPEYEARALALAWATLRLLDPDYRPPAAIGRPRMPGCFEIVGGVVLDGAHTPRSIALLAGELGRRFGDRPRALLFASARGKRWRESLESLLPGLEFCAVTSLTGTSYEAPQQIVDWLRDRGVEALAVPDARAGLAALHERDAVRVVTGSFYLVGAALELLR